MTRHPKVSRTKRLVSWLVSAAMLAPAMPPAFAVSSNYAGFVSQTPGYYNTPPDVNVMFTLDDSGSMWSDVIPDLSEKQSGFPGTGVSDSYYGGGSFGTKFPTMWREKSGFLRHGYYQHDNKVARYLRSSTSNPIYYDPDVRYRPWPLAGDELADKGYSADAKPSQVRIHQMNPFDKDADTINLGVEIDAGGGKFWPATYFVYKGSTPIPTGDPDHANNVQANFDKIEIKPTTATYARAATRTDCTTSSTSCSYKEELQNFANWLQYYHSRMLMAKGGVAAAFAQQGTNLRVGLSTLAKLNSSGSGLSVAPFKGTARKGFYDSLYPIDNAGSTYLRIALDRVGQFFATKTGTGNPWLEDPADAGSTQWSCRRSFHFLSSDGYWNDSKPSWATEDAWKNNDNFSGDTPERHSPKRTYKFSDTLAADPDDELVNRFTINPFNDGATQQSVTLADIAAYYWKTDLRSSLKNDVVPSSRNPAFWQHISTFTIGLGVTGSGAVKYRVGGGTVDLSTQEKRDELVRDKIQLNWPKIVSGEDTTGDDLIHAAMVSRGRYFSATDPTQLASGLADALAEVADQPLDQASVAADAPQVQSGNRVYQATFSPARWYGRLYAFSQDPNTGKVNNKPSRDGELNASQLWEASLNLPAPAARNIFTSQRVASSYSGELFEWSALSAAQQSDLGGDQNVLNFLRGDASMEAVNGGTFRDRSRYKLGGKTGGTLGDIVNGSPIKGPDAGAGYDRLGTHAAAERDSYSTFRLGAGLDDLRQTIFVNANDGMAHAININDGVERFAYVPASVYSVPRSNEVQATEKKLKMLSELSYPHRFTVDGPPNVADAYFGGAWHTLMVSSTGAGSRGIFAIDVTNPTVAGGSGFDKSKIMWEFSEADNADMGFVLSYPHLARMRDGTWAAIFGNGYDSANGQAVLFIVDVSTGKVLKQIAVGAVGNNGLSQPNFILNAEREVTHIFAGDVKGNLWKFDVDDADPAKWGNPFGTAPLFRTLVTGGVAQPITVMPEITEHPNGGQMISFGTGKLFEKSDTATGATNVNLKRQSIYGIWDKPGETAGITAPRSTALVEHLAPTIPSSADFGLTTGSPPDWTQHRGWFMDLEGSASGERVNLPAQHVKSILFVVANTPMTNDRCANGGTSKIFALDPVTGEAPPFAVFDVNGDGKVDAKEAKDNVRINRSGLLTQPIFQVAATGTASTIPSIALSPYAVFDRGQATAARSGGVELSRSFGGSVDKKWDCNMLMTAAQSDTSLQSLLAQVCPPPPGKGRISWRQLQ